MRFHDGESMDSGVARQLAAGFLLCHSTQLGLEATPRCLRAAVSCPLVGVCDHELLCGRARHVLVTFFSPSCPPWTSVRTPALSSDLTNALPVS